MPVYDRVYPYMSYITAAGDEIILSEEGNHKLWDCYSRSGFSAPQIEPVRSQDADGTYETLSVRIKPRKLSVKMVIVGNSSMERDTILDDLARRLIQVGNRRDWGKLKVLRSDGIYMYIDCVYTGGIDSVVRNIHGFQYFELNFQSDDGYFYEANSTVHNINVYKETGVLRLQFTFPAQMKSTGLNFTEIITLDGYMAYPTITVTGPADNIQFENKETGRVIEFDPGFFLLKDETLVINTLPKNPFVTVTRQDGTEENGFAYLTENTNLDWYLVSGDNEVVYRQSNNNSVTTCTLSYQQRWLSA